MRKDEYIKNKIAKEDKAMNWLSKKLNIDYTKETYLYSSYDGIITSGNTDYLTEVKIREKYSKKEIDGYGGAILEFNKLNGILNYKHSNNNFNNIIYVMFFKDCCVLYKLKCDPNSYKWELKWLQRNDYDKEREWKFVTILKEDDIISKINYK